MSGRRPARPKDDRAGSRPPRRQAAARGGKGAGKRVRAPAADSRKPTTVRKPILVDLDDELKQRMINTVGWTGPAPGFAASKPLYGVPSNCYQYFEREHNQGNPFDLVEDRTEA